MTGGLFIASLTLYIISLAPSVVTLFDDSLEFQLVTYQLGIAHPTGYPLYTILGKLFTLLPAGNVAYRVNLMSAVFGAAAVALPYFAIVCPQTRSTACHLHFYVAGTSWWRHWRIPPGYQPGLLAAGYRRRGLHPERLFCRTASAPGR